MKRGRLWFDASVSFMLHCAKDRTTVGYFQTTGLFFAEVIFYCFQHHTHETLATDDIMFLPQNFLSHTCLDIVFKTHPQVFIVLYCNMILSWHKWIFETKCKQRKGQIWCTRSFKNTRHQQSQLCCVMIMVTCIRRSWSYKAIHFQIKMYTVPNLSLCYTYPIKSTLV